MSKIDFFKRGYIKICRYFFRKKYLPVMAGPLKGYLWSTSGSYEYILGNYEDPEVLKTFLSWLKTGSVYYDIGSNTGFYALTANRVIKSGKIYAFEPLPSVRQTFEDHIRLNSKLMGNNNISILPFAVADAEKQVQFSNNIMQTDGNTYIKESPVFSSAKNKITVQCYSVDDLLQQGYDKPDIIKIDAEGHELNVLKGAIEIIGKSKPPIAIELSGGVSRITETVEFLKTLGYAHFSAPKRDIDRNSIFTRASEFTAKVSGRRRPVQFRKIENYIFDDYPMVLVQHKDNLLAVDGTTPA
jgi:FkbM family methyltransferase